MSVRMIQPYSTTSLYILSWESLSSFFFFFNDTAPPEIYPLPLHDALPISPLGRRRPRRRGLGRRDHGHAEHRRGRHDHHDSKESISPEHQHQRSSSLPVYRARRTPAVKSSTRSVKLRGRLDLQGGQRQLDDQAAARDVGGTDRAVVQLEGPVRDGQPQADAAGPPLA